MDEGTLNRSTRRRCGRDHQVYPILASELRWAMRFGVYDLRLILVLGLRSRDTFMYLGQGVGRDEMYFEISRLLEFTFFRQGALSGK